MFYKQLYYFQGVQGPSGPPGDKGISGEPVSLSFVYMNSTTASGNQPYYCNDFFCFFPIPSDCLQTLNFHADANTCVHINVNQPMFSLQSPKQPNTISLIVPRSHRQEPRTSETETIWFTPCLSWRGSFIAVWLSPSQQVFVHHKNIGSLFWNLLQYRLTDHHRSTLHAFAFFSSLFKLCFSLCCHFLRGLSNIKK